MSVWVRWFLVGCLATVTMDIGATLFREAGVTMGLSPRLIGRWFAYVLRGQLSHHSILESPPVPGEMPLAIAGHYLIGVVLTLVFAAGLYVQTRGPISAGMTFTLALGFGLLTNLLPFFIMFPAMGFGDFGLAGPPALLLYRTSLLNHVLFGAGLGLFARLFRVLG